MMVVIPVLLVGGGGGDFGPQGGGRFWSKKIPTPSESGSIKSSVIYFYIIKLLYFLTFFPEFSTFL